MDTLPITEKNSIKEPTDWLVTILGEEFRVKAVTRNEARKLAAYEYRKRVITGLPVHVLKSASGCINLTQRLTRSKYLHPVTIEE
jgi:hypothetical protein